MARSMSVNPTAWIQILRLSITCCIALDKLLNFSMSSFLIYAMGIVVVLTDMVVVSTELIHVKCVEQCVAQSKHLTIIIC